MAGDVVDRVKDMVIRRDFCREQIAHYKVPRYIRFLNDISEMPMTITGKVQKFVMRDRMIEELKLTQTRTA